MFFCFKSNSGTAFEIFVFAYFLHYLSYLRRWLRKETDIRYCVYCFDSLAHQIFGRIGFRQYFYLKTFFHFLRCTLFTLSLMSILMKWVNLLALSGFHLSRIVDSAWSKDIYNFFPEFDIFTTYFKFRWVDQSC